MKYSLNILTIILVLLFGTASKSFSQGDYVVIVNSDVIEASLSKSELRRVFFGFTTQWKNFEKVKPAYQVSEYPSFWESISTSESKFKNFWTKRVFSGNGVAPRDFDNTKSLVEYVAETKGAIGVIPASMKSSVGSGCKIIQVNE